MATAANATPSVLRLARGSLSAAVVVLALAAGLVWLADDRRDQALREAATALQQLEQARTELASVQGARARLEANLRRYEALRAGGFVGAPDRVGLLEALEQAARALPDVPLRWDLSADQPGEAFQDPASGQPLAQVQVVPMQLAADHVHETEWLDLLARLRQSARGQVRVDGCELRHNPYIAGVRELPSLRAACALDWIHIVPSAPATAPAAR